MADNPELNAIQVRIAFNYTGVVNSESRLNILYATSDADTFRTSNLLYERHDKRLSSSNRSLIYNQNPCISLSVSLDTLQPEVQAYLRECVCRSTVIVVSILQNPTIETPVLFMFVEFPPNQNMFLLDGYINNLRNNRLQCLQSMWTSMFPAQEFIPDPISQISQENHVNQIGQVGQIGQVDQVDQVGQIGQVGQIDQVDQVGQIGHASQVAQVEPVISASESMNNISQILEPISSPIASLAPNLAVAGRIANIVVANPVMADHDGPIGLVGLVGPVGPVGPVAPPRRVLIPRGPYDPRTHKVSVLLNLDKTLILSYADAREEQLHAFVADFEISGNMAITNERFQYRIMLRPGVYWFLRRLAQVAEIYVVTAGDLHYARAIVTHANARSWISSRDPTTDNEQNLTDVSIPLTRVFSTRYHPSRSVFKTFGCALPFAQFMDASAVLAVDNDPGAWDIAVRQHVIPISPFQPLNNSSEHLLHVIWLIEQAAQRFFNSIHTDIARLPPLPPFSVLDGGVGGVGGVGGIGGNIRIQFFNSGRYVLILNTGLVFDCSNGANMMLSPIEVTRFYVEHQTIGQPYTLDSPPGVPVGIQFFQDGRYVLLTTDLHVNFLAFLYGNIMNFSDVAALVQFIQTVRPMAPPCYVGTASAIVDANVAANVAADVAANVVSDVIADVASDIALASPIVAEESSLVRFFNQGRYAVQIYPNRTSMIYDYANGGMSINHLSNNPMALAQFLTTLIPDRTCNREIKIIIQSKNIALIVRDMSNL